MADEDLSTLLESFTRRRSRGIIPTLEVIQRLLEILDNPHKRLRVVHVAGTNGKGSVCAMLESVLRHSGLQTGLYTSPHLVDFRERIRAGKESADPVRLAQCLAQVERADRQTGMRPATFFEAITAAAFLYFCETGVDIVVLETGMGGRWDATNVVSPDLAVITPIDVDHTEFLGSDVGRIAWEKCGIMKPGVVTVCAPQSSAVWPVLEEQARERLSRLIPASELVHLEAVGAPDLQGQNLGLATPLGRLDVRLPLAGSFQRTNCMTATAAAVCLAQSAGYPVTLNSLRQGLENVQWIGRFQVLGRNPLVIVDGAHNVHGARALAATLDELIPHCPIALVAGFLRDKDVCGIGRELARRVGAAWCVRPRSERGMEAGDAASRLAEVGIKAVPGELEYALEQAVLWAQHNGGAVLVCGSLYLAGEVLEHWKGQKHLRLAAKASESGGGF